MSEEGWTPGKPEWLEELNRACMRYTSHDEFSEWCALRSMCWDIEAEQLVDELRREAERKEWEKKN